MNQPCESSKTWNNRCGKRPGKTGKALTRASAAWPLTFSLLALTLAGSGCSEKVSYGYADIHVTIDQATISREVLATIITCDVQILGTGTDESRSLPCRENRVPYDVGTLEWTTSTTGPLQFVVRVGSVNHVLVGEGTSDYVTVATGKRTKVELKVVGVGPPAGADAAATTPDGSADAATATDADVDAAPPQPADAAVSSPD